MSRDVDCKEVSRLISSGQDQSLSKTDRARLRLHFVICETCRDVQAQLEFLRRAIKRLDRDPPEPPR